MKKAITTALALMAAGGFTVTASAEYVHDNGVFYTVTQNAKTPYTGYVTNADGTTGYYKDGKPYTGWIAKDGDNIYYQGGHILKGLQKWGGVYVYFNDNGAFQTGEHFINGSTKDFGNNGAWDGKIVKNFVFNEAISGSYLSYVVFNNKKWYLLPLEAPAENDVQNAAYAGKITKTRDEYVVAYKNDGTPYRDMSEFQNFETLIFPEGTKLYLEKSGTLIAKNENSFFGKASYVRLTDNEKKADEQGDRYFRSSARADDSYKLPPYGGKYRMLLEDSMHWLSCDGKVYYASRDLLLNNLTVEFIKQLPFIGETKTQVGSGSHIQGYLTDDLQATDFKPGTKLYKYGDSEIVAVSKDDYAGFESACIYAYKRPIRNNY